MPKPAFLIRLLTPLLVSISAWPQSPVGELFPSDVGSTPTNLLAGSGSTVVSGSHLSAGASPATLRLARGGQVLICPRSRLTVNSDVRGLMLGMDAGNIEVDFQSSQGVTDMAYTPDFSILLAGPGKYHFAVGVNAQGDTCFKPLNGNTSGVVFSELLGSDVYGLAAEEAALFSGGKLGARKSLQGDCGCPAPPPPNAVRAEASPVPTPESPPPRPSSTPATTLSSTTASPSSSAAPDAGSTPHPVTVDAPFVFSADATPPVAKVEYSSLPNVFLTQEDPERAVLSDRSPAQPAQAASAGPSPTPAPQKKEKKKGFMARLKGFFGGMFGR